MKTDQNPIHPGHHLLVPAEPRPSHPGGHQAGIGTARPLPAPDWRTSVNTPLQRVTGISLADERERVTLVDVENNVVGSCGKMAAHRDGKLHRAFSIVITNPEGALLLQRRAARKYHFANLWSNACCGHPRPGEATPAAARRRLAEELGFTVPLTQVAAFPYFAEDAVSGLVEHEYLHVFHGVFTGQPVPNPAEVGACRWMLPARVRRGLVARPSWFTPWFALLTVGRQAEDLRLVID